MKIFTKFICLCLITLNTLELGLATDFNNDDNQVILSSQPQHIQIAILKHMSSHDIKTVLLVNKDFNQCMQHKELWYIYCQNAKFIPSSALYDSTQDYDSQYKFFANPSLTLFYLRQDNRYRITAMSADARTLVGEFFTAPLMPTKQVNENFNGYFQVCVANCCYQQNFYPFGDENCIKHLIHFKSIKDNESIIQNSVIFEYAYSSDDGLTIIGRLSDIRNHSWKKPCVLSKNKKSENYDLEYLDQPDSTLINIKIKTRRDVHFKELHFYPQFKSCDAQVFSGYIEYNGPKIPHIYITNQEEFTLASYLREYGILGSNIEITSIDVMTSNGVAIVGQAYDNVRKQNFIYRATIPTARNKF